MISSPQLPPKAGYVEVEIDGSRTYRNVKTGVLIYDERPPTVSEVDILKKQLSDTDYKIIKCSEYQLTGVEPPYDIAVLHAERQVLRDKINETENKETELV